MKKIYMFVSVLTVFVLFQGFQVTKDKNIKHLMKDYRHEKGFMMVSVPAFVVRPFIPEEEQAVKHLMKNVKMFRVLISHEEVDPRTTDRLALDVQNFFGGIVYRDLVEIKTDDENVIIKGKVDRDRMTELIVFVNTREESVIVQITGDFLLEDLANTTKMLAERH